MTNKKLGCTINLQDLYEARTINKLALKIPLSKKNKYDIVVPLLTNLKTSKNIFIFHPVSGMVFCYNELVANWKLDFAIYGIQDPSIFSDKIIFSSLTQMAELYLQEIKHIQPTGPYYLLGYSYGGTLAYEIANLLHQQGDKVEFLGMIDGWEIFSEKQYDEFQFKKLMKQYNESLSDNMIEVSWQRMQLLLNHVPTKTNQDMLLFKASEMLAEYQHIDEEYNGWRQFNTGNIIVYSLDATHESIVNSNNMALIYNLVATHIG